jgi:hypothetical protein
MRYVLLLCLAALPVAAQVDAGYVTGHVYDNSNAAIPQVAVEIRNVDTGYELKLSTNESGLYASPPLPAGRYRISVNQQGFQATAKEITLNLAERLGIDFTLSISTQTQSVDVTAVASVLQTENTTLSTFRSEGEVKDFPSNSRNYADIVRFSPGVAPAEAQSNNLALSEQRGNTANSANGVVFTANYFLVDGLYNNENHQGQGLMLFPEVEAIEQYRVETSVPDARFGGAGAAVNVGYKSGTSQYHGDVFYFSRNSIFDARNYFATGDKPSLSKNLYGGIIGGPIGGHDAKTFFFLSYEGERTEQAVTFLSTVPTTAMKNGDFSTLLTPKPTTIYDPRTTTPSGSTYTRTPFPGNIIPAASMNAVAKKLMALYPDPNQPGLASNLLLNPNNTTSNDQGSVKIDRNFTSGSRGFVRVTRGEANYVNPQALGPVATASVGVDVPVTQAVVSYTHIFSPRTINQSRFGFTREALNSVTLNGGQNLAQQIGIANVNVDNFSTGLPQVAVTGFTTMGDFQNRPAIIAMNYFQYSTNFDMMRGNHSLKAGMDAVRRQTNVYQATYPRGLFNFGTIYTSNPASPANTGFSAADLLLGNPQSVQLTGLNGTRGFRRIDWSFYFQDDWKINQHLTLNVGLRYEYPQGYPNTEVANRMVQFDVARGLPVPVAQTGYASGVPGDKNNWAPRAGLAYRLNNRTVFRSAWGVFYSIPAQPIGSSLASNAPNFYNTTVTNNQFDFPGARPIEAGPLRSIDPNATGLNYTGLATNYVIGYIQQWNAALQRALPGSQQLTVAYVGTKGTHLDGGLDFNQPVPGSGAINSRRRWPNDSTVTIISSRGNSTYHSLQTTLVRSFAAGLTYQIGYTYAHLIQNSSGNLPITDLRGEKGNGATDLRHHLRATVTYELPFGKGKPFLSGMPGAVNAALGGWKTLAAVSMYSGFPFTVMASSNTLNNGVATRANRIANGNLAADQRTLQQWFDVNAFTNPGLLQWGNSGPNVIYGPGTKELDFSLFKQVRVAEKKSLEFRAECFNLTNTPQFNNPGATIGVPAAGRVSSAGSNVTLQRTERQIQLALKFIF